MPGGELAFGDACARFGCGHAVAYELRLGQQPLLTSKPFQQPWIWIFMGLLTISDLSIPKFESELKMLKTSKIVRTVAEVASQAGEVLSCCVTSNSIKKP